MHTHLVWLRFGSNDEYLILHYNLVTDSSDLDRF